MNKEPKSKDVAGGSPSQGSPKDEKKQIDESKKPTQTVKKDAIKESEKGNMTDKKGYNETPPSVPVKSTKQ